MKLVTVTLNYHEWANVTGILKAANKAGKSTLFIDDMTFSDLADKMDAQIEKQLTPEEYKG